MPTSRIAKTGFPEWSLCDFDSHRQPHKKRKMLNPGMRFIFASALLLLPLHAQAAPSVPNDCWFGVMSADKAPHGQLVAAGAVAQWRVGMSLVVYPTKENYEQIIALAEKGQTGTFDTSRPIMVIPTWISGPEPGDKDSDEVKASKLRCSIAPPKVKPARFF